MIKTNLTLEQLRINQRNKSSCDYCNINKHNKKHYLTYCTSSNPILNGNYHIALCNKCLKELDQNE